jgi:hypothetical protein
LDFAVTTVSSISIEEFILLSIDLLFLTISVGPDCSDTVPIAALLF